MWLCLIIVLAVLLIYLSNNRHYENFNPSLNYSRVYPGIFSFRDHDLWRNYPFNYGFFRYNPGYRDYYYIPMHESLDLWTNGPYGRGNNCVVPPSISSECMAERLSDGVTYEQALINCTVPSSISESCNMF